MLKTINPPSGGACVLCRCRYAFVQEVRLLWPVCTNLPDFRRLSLHPSDAVRATEQTGGRPDRIFRILTMGKGRNDFRSSKEKKKVFPLSGMQKQQYLMGGLRTIQGAMRLAVGYCRRTGYHPRFRSRFHGFASPKQNKTLALFILSSEENRCFMA